MLSRLLAHDRWTTQELLTICDRLDESLLDHPFDIGHKTIRETLHHIIHNVEVWSLLMAGEAVEPQTARSISAMKRRLDVAADRLGAVAQDIAARNAWDEQWLDRLEDPPRMKFYGTSIAHVITHSMHHRAQLLYMMRKAGLTSLPEGDVFSWEKSIHDENASNSISSKGAVIATIHESPANRRSNE